VSSGFIPSNEGKKTEDALVTPAEAVMPAYTTTAEVRTCLDALGLNIGILSTATMSSELARSRATALHPPLTGGFNGWADAVASLRADLMPLGWEKSDKANYCTVVSPDGSFQIAVSSGDEFTGIEARTPRTKCPKGPETARAVELNQYSLFPSEMPAQTLRSQGSLGTWILLIRRDSDVLRAELSFPASIDDDDHVAEWAERIILPAMDLTDPGLGSRIPVPEPGPDAEVEVLRRNV
jgi:hypothetical protein